METPLTPLNLTRTLLSFNTINPPGREEACARFLGKLLEKGGYTTEFYEIAAGRPNIVARLEGTSGKPPLCFTGHIDTVPLGATAWTRDPFAGEVEGDKLYGRGSSDMKGGIAAMVIAALRIAELSRGKANITVIISADEETGCHGAQFLADRGSIVGNAGALIVGEPTANYPLVGHKGALFLEARTTGVTAHGSMPEKGVNAIYKAAAAITKLQKFAFHFPHDPIYGSPTLSVGTVTGGTTVNIVPDEAVIGIDIRTVPGQVNRRVYEEIRACLGEDVAIDILTDATGVSTDPDNAWVQQVFDIMTSFSKERPVARGATYFTDASELTPALGNPPTILLGPGEPSMAHKTDEYCHISKIEEATEVYREIAAAWCGL